ncbi:MAG: Gfo/Idh/MocA family oxidoreductase [Pseudomonadota bacterium]
MTLRVACLGAGYFANFQLDAWVRLDRVELVGIADLNPARAAQAALAYGTASYPSLEDMLATTKPDILDIAVPPEGHAEAIATGLDHGPSAIICQKPFCTSLAEAERMTTIAQRAGIRLIVHENFRFQPWYRTIREALRDGQIGTPQNLTFRLRTGDGQGPQAYLDRQPYFQTMPRFLVHETCVHWIDVFRFLLEADPTAVYADLRQLNAAIAGEDAGHLIFDFPDGARAIFDGNRLLDHPAENPRLTLGEAVIEGPRGCLTLDGYGCVTQRPFGKQQATTLLAPQAWQGFGGDCVYQLQSHVVAALLDGNPIENEAQDYLVVRRVEEGAYRSSQMGCKISLT